MYSSMFYCYNYIKFNAHHNCLQMIIIILCAAINGIYFLEFECNCLVLITRHNLFLYLLIFFIIPTAILPN